MDCCYEELENVYTRLKNTPNDVWYKRADDKLMEGENDLEMIYSTLINLMGPYNYTCFEVQVLIIKKYFELLSQTIDTAPRCNTKIILKKLSSQLPVILRQMIQSGFLKTIQPNCNEKLKSVEFLKDNNNLITLVHVQNAIRPLKSNG